MGTNDEGLLSQKYFQKANEYFQFGFTNKNLQIRYKYWNIAQYFKNIAENFEKLEKKGVNTNV